MNELCEKNHVAYIQCSVHSCCHLEVVCEAHVCYEEICDLTNGKKYYLLSYERSSVGTPHKWFRHATNVLLTLEPIEMVTYDPDRGCFIHPQDAQHVYVSSTVSASERNPINPVTALGIIVSALHSSY
jgi:hypothetical protein